LVLELTYKNKGATRKEVDESLNWLYFNGLITYPKTASINLSHQTISELFAYGKNMGWQIEKTPHEFSGSDDENERSEALHPVSWDISPEDLQYTENWRSNKHKELSYWIYNQIYQRAKESQSPQKNGEEKRHFLSGPLFLTRKEAIEKQGKKFSITKENELQAHMNVLLGSRDPWENIPENYVLESNEVYIKERKVSLPENINIPLLIERLASENIGRIETLEHLANLLLEQAIIETSPTTKLSRKGNAIVDELERSMGEYMDLNYYKCLTDMFKKIELGQKNPEEFLNEWWYNFRTILESSRQARGDQNTKKPVSTKNHDSNSRREDDYNKNTIPDQQQKRVKYG
jgi:DNA topoisomerase IA